MLSFHYKVYKVKGNLVFSGKETVSYYWERLMYFLGLREREEPPEEENILPAVCDVGSSVNLP